MFANFANIVCHVSFNIYNRIQAGAELGQAHVKLEVSVELKSGARIVVKVRGYTLEQDCGPRC